MSETLRILIVDGNTQSVNHAQKALGGSATGEGYAEVVHRIKPNAQTVIVNPTYPDYQRQSVSLEGFDRAVITGSALHVYDASKEVENQLRLVDDVLTAGIPTFGSCWGIQIGVVVLGGKVRANPNGTEFGIARNIHLTEAGKAHFLYRNKSVVFDALAIHGDEVEHLPEGSTILSSNEISNVQAIEVHQGNKRFWGVQYHPEYDFNEMSGIVSRYGKGLIEEGYFETEEALQQCIEDFKHLHHEPSKALCWKYGIQKEVVDFYLRTLEIRNWLNASL